MRKEDYNSSTSGYLADSFEGISTIFTDMEVLSMSQTHFVVRAKRYGRWWVLKGLQAEVAGQEAYRQRLRKEFEILMQLQHPAVVVPAGLESVDGLGVCIVMEYVDGITLAEWLKGKTRRSQRLSVARQVAEAVRYVHTKNIVHRDLKPGNIVITRNGDCVKLIDFGLADTDSHAVLKQPAGTLRYISPEQLHTAVTDVRNDIYSLGKIFSQMDLRYGRIVRKCLLPAEKRYQNMDELLAAMLARKRKPMHVALSAAAAIMALLCVVVVILTTHLQKMKSEQKRQEMEQERQKVAYDQQKAAYSQQKAAYDQQKEMYDQQKAISDQQMYARLRVKESKQAGYASIDNALQALGIAQIVDTLSFQIYLPADFYARVDKFNNAVTACVNGLDNSFTEDERNEISMALYMHGNQAISSLMEQLLKKPSNPQ